MWGTRYDFFHNIFIIFLFLTSIDEFEDSQIHIVNDDWLALLDSAEQYLVMS